MRAQLIVRAGKVFLWSRGEELITDKFPEFAVLTKYFDGTVVDGELIPYKERADRRLQCATKTDRS